MGLFSVFQNCMKQIQFTDHSYRFHLQIKYLKMKNVREREGEGERAEQFSIMRSYFERICFSKAEQPVIM